MVLFHKPKERIVTKLHPKLSIFLSLGKIPLTEFLQSTVKCKTYLPLAFHAFYQDHHFLQLVQKKPLMLQLDALYSPQTIHFRRAAQRQPWGQA